MWSRLVSSLDTVRPTVCAAALYPPTISFVFLRVLLVPSRFAKLRFVSTIDRIHRTQAVSLSHSTNLHQFVCVHLTFMVSLVSRRPPVRGGTHSRRPVRTERTSTSGDLHSLFSPVSSPRSQLSTFQSPCVCDNNSRKLCQDYIIAIKLHTKNKQVSKSGEKNLCKSCKLT